MVEGTYGSNDGRLGRSCQDFWSSNCLWGGDLGSGLPGFLNCNDRGEGGDFSNSSGLSVDSNGRLGGGTG